jgi:hypothetical protein
LTSTPLLSPRRLWTPPAPAGTATISPVIRGCRHRRLLWNPPRSVDVTPAIVDKRRRSLPGKLSHGGWSDVDGRLDLAEAATLYHRSTTDSVVAAAAICRPVVDATPSSCLPLPAQQRGRTPSPASPSCPASWAASSAATGAPHRLYDRVESQSSPDWKQLVRVPSRQQSEEKSAAGLRADPNSAPAQMVSYVFCLQQQYESAHLCQARYNVHVSFRLCAERSHSDYMQRERHGLRVDADLLLHDKSTLLSRWRSLSLACWTASGRRPWSEALNMKTGSWYPIKVGLI